MKQGKVQVLGKLASNISVQSYIHIPALLSIYMHISCLLPLSFTFPLVFLCIQLGLHSSSSSSFRCFSLLLLLFFGRCSHFSLLLQFPDSMFQQLIYQHSNKQVIMIGLITGYSHLLQPSLFIWNATEACTLPRSARHQLHLKNESGTASPVTKSIG